MEESEVECNGETSEEEGDSPAESEVKNWTNQLTALEERIGEVAAALEGGEGEWQEGHGISMDKRMLQLKLMSDDLSKDKTDVDRILDSPSLHRYLDSHTPSPAAAVVHSRAEMLHMRCQGVVKDLDSCIAELSAKIEQRREGIITDLDGLEGWLQEAYSLVLLEPNRLLYPPGLVDEGQLKAPSEGSSVMGEEGEWQGRGSDVSGEFEESQSAGGGGEEEGGAEGGLGENGGFSEELLRGSGSDDEEGVAEEDMEYSVLFTMSADPEEEGQEEEPEGEEEQKGLNDEIVNGKEEMGESGVNDGGEEINIVKAEDSDDSPSQTATMETGTSEEGKSTSEETAETGDSDNLEWVRELRLLPQYHAPTLRKDLGLRRVSVDEMDLECLVSQLEKHAREMPIQSQKFKKVKANVNFVISSLPAESVTEYKERLSQLETRWEWLDKELHVRLVQLSFERNQKDIIEALQEALSELDHQPNVNLFQEEVEEKHADLLDFIISVEQFNSLKDEQIASLIESLDKLQALGDGTGEGEGQGEELIHLKELVENCTEAYNQVARKITLQERFQAKCLELWAEFKKMLIRSDSWLDKTERLVSKDSYGYTLKEAEAYVQEIKFLRQSIPAQEELGSQLVSLGKTLLTTMEEGGPAEQYVDEQLSNVDSRLSDLVTPHSGNVDTREAAVSKVITDWRGYIGMLSGTRSFISQMAKMVGPEPIESSNGNATLLNTYVAYGNQIKQIEVQYKRLVAAGESLASNPHVGSNAVFAQELKDLEMQWGPLRDNVMDTLELLTREYNDWIMVNLQHMNELVTEAQELIQQELLFIHNFPHDDIMGSDVGELLQEADTLVASQDHLVQMEGECTQIEEKLLDRQIQQESFGGFSGSQSSLEYPSTSTEKARLLKEREQAMGHSEALQPVLNIIYLQLQLLGSMHECNQLISKAMDFIGPQNECESMLSELELKLSGDRIERLQGQAYDAGVVMEELQEDEVQGVAEKLGYTLPTGEELLGVNKTLAAGIETVESNADQAKLRIQLLIDWWKEFHGNYGDVTLWLEEVETNINQLLARYHSTQPPRVSPIDLLQEIKELDVEVQEKSVLVCALESTGSNIQEEMEVKGVEPGDMPAQVAAVRSRWEELRKTIEMHMAEIGASADRFDRFLSSMTSFVNWLSEFHSKLYDEVCVQIPPKAKEELVSRHKNRLEVFRAEVSTYAPKLEGLKVSCEEWAEHLVPEVAMDDLPSPSEPSPAPDEEDSDFPPDSQLHYVRKQTDSMNRKWANIQQMLQEREQQLEISMGSYQSFMEHAQDLLSWLQGKLDMGALFGLPPADLDVVEGFQRDVELTKEELDTRVASLKTLEHMAAGLRGQVTPPVAEKLDRLVEEARETWAEVEKGTVTRKEVLSPLVESLREFKQESSKVEAWLKLREAEFEDCGTIGANLDRCLEQADILERLDEVLLNGKRSMEEVQVQVMTLVDDRFEAESRARVQEWASGHEQRYMKLSEETMEQKERCDEATAALQSLMKQIGQFEEWVGKMEGVLEERKKEKRPIGTLQTVLEEHYEFMQDIETHTEEYLVLVPEGRGLMDEYHPNDWLGGVMQKLKDKWFGYVDALCDRAQELLALVEMWNQYEQEVKELLGWIMSEAESFSEDVTTYGDKGVVDHMETCENFMNTLKGKNVKIDEIADQASLLKAEDTEKKNGTSDVESRWNDVQMHWNSCCKLLSETLLHLEATEAEMRHVLLIRAEEYDWLEECERHAHQKERTHGNLELLQNEIERHEQLFEQVQAHEEARQFLLSTVPFLTEHSRKAEREEMKLKADEFDQRFGELGKSLESHVSMLKDSVPFWKRFNSNVEDLSQWLNQVNSDLVSENVQFGNAKVTEESLVFCQGLLVDIQGHSSLVHDVSSLGEVLAKYVIPEDQEFVKEWVERLTKGEEHVVKETEEKTELLEERMKSWRVFPVEEARVVQEFLAQVETEVVEDEIAEEDLTSEQLLEKLERLERLQELQSTNQGMMTTIDQSSHSADVQRALERNPDISKERTNLLQGWSNVSFTLKDKISLMRRRAEMVQHLEVVLRKAEEGVAQYRTHLDTPLPASVLLVERHTAILENGVSLQDSCQSCLGKLQAQLDQYDRQEQEDLQVPQRFKEKATSLQEQHSDLVTRGERRKKEVLQTVNSWEEFVAGVEELTSWLRSEVDPELAELRQVEDFAMEFSSHQARLEALSGGDVEEHRPTFAAVSDSAPRHTQGEEPEVEDVLKRYTEMRKAWTSATEEIADLEARSKPWKELTDRFDELCSSLERVEGLVDADENSIETLDEAEGGGLSDLIVNFKDYLKRLGQLDDSFAAMEASMAELLTPEVCEGHEPCKELRSECTELQLKWEELKKRVERILANLIGKELAWKETAAESIRQLATLKGQIHTYEYELEQKDREIMELRNRPPTIVPVPQRSSGCRYMLGMVAAVVGVITLAYLFLWKVDPEVSPI